MTELEHAPPLADALRAQFATLSTIFDALHLVVYVADFDTHEVLFVNSHMEQTFGREWPGRQCFKYIQAGQTSPCSFCTNHLLVKDGKPAPPHIWEFQNTINHRWYLCIDRAIPWLDGRLVRMETAVDITDRKEAERFREQYVGLVSHDLGNPLNSIVLTANLLERSLRKKNLERELEEVKRIQAGAKRIEAMTRDLLDSVGLESGSAKLLRERADLSLVALAIRDALSPEDRTRVVLEAPDPAPEVMGDRAQLERVLDNLISNALKHSPPESPVSVEIARAGAKISVVVRDQGAGIPIEHQPHIFERFYRVPETRAQGLGLGLYIARLIIERHGGEVGVESEPERGSRFFVTLPAAP